MRYKIIFLHLLFSVFGFTQEKKCINKSVGFIQHKLPQSICLEKDEMIYDFFDNFDFNDDGLFDIAIEVNKDKLKDGDTSKLIIYRQINDSIYIKFKDLYNIYPLWFEDYSSKKKLDSSHLQKVKDFYEGKNPLRAIDLTENKIILHLIIDAVTEKIMTYSFNKSKNDFTLSECKRINIITQEIFFDNSDIGASINNFSYEKSLTGQ